MPDLRDFFTNFIPTIPFELEFSFEFELSSMDEMPTSNFFKPQGYSTSLWMNNLLYAVRAPLPAFTTHNCKLDSGTSSIVLADLKGKKKEEEGHMKRRGSVQWVCFNLKSKRRCGNFTGPAYVCLVTDRQRMLNNYHEASPLRVYFIYGRIEILRRAACHLATTRGPLKNFKGGSSSGSSC